MAFFSAIRNFAKELKQNGHQVLYLKIDNPNNQQSFEKNLNQLIENNSIREFEYQLPDEFRPDLQFNRYTETLSIPFKAYDSEHFLTFRFEFRAFFKGKKSYLMESF